MQNGLSTILALSSIAWLAGCQGLSDRQRQWLADGEKAYAEGQHSRAIERLTLLLNGATNQPEVSRALYVRALARVQSNQRLAARSDLTRCIDTTKDQDIRWRALAVLGTIDYEDRQWATAARAYAAAADSAPKQPPTDVLLFRLGVCYERLGRWAEALTPYQRIVGEFVTGSVADAARRRLLLKADHFAVQCGAFSGAQNAEQLVAELKRDGLPAYVRSEQRNGTPVSIVLVGHYARYDEAAGELARIKGYVPNAVLWP